MSLEEKLANGLLKNFFNEHNGTITYSFDTAKGERKEVSIPRNGTLHIVDAGAVPINEIHDLQKQLEIYHKTHKEVVDDYLLIFQSKHPHLYLGGNQRKNKLTPEIETKLAQKYADKFPDGITLKKEAPLSGSFSIYRPEFLAQLEKDGLDNLEVQQHKGGGGTALFNEGTYMFYPNIHISERMKELHTPTYTSIMMHILNHIMVESLEKYSPLLVEELGESDFLITNTTDVYVLDANNKKCKVTSRGVRTITNMPKSVTQYGFCIYVDKSAEELALQYIHPCGISPDEGRVVALESLTNKKIDPVDIKTNVIQLAQKYFGYEDTALTSYKQFKSFVKTLSVK